MVQALEALDSSDATTGTTTCATTTTTTTTLSPLNDNQEESHTTKRKGRHKKSSSSVHNGNRIKSKLAIGEYNLTSTIGSGGMGKVKLAVHQSQPQKKLAVKIISRIDKGRKKDPFREDRTLREANLLYLLHHPYIVNLEAPAVVDQHYYYLMMEHVSGGQLLDYIISHGKLREKDARRFARQMMSALDYCHRNSIVHRDLKIENILISRTGHVKIIDFGLSNLFSPDSQLSTFCGSLYFAAPELLHAKSYMGPEVDVWSFGVVLYVLVCGRVPFDDNIPQALHEKIKRGSVDYPSHLTHECKNLLNKVLVTNPSYRATVSEILVHPWMTRGYDGPVDNHLPERAPLTLPLDMAIVCRMTVFNFGSEEEIKMQLEQIISSDKYLKASRLRCERSHSRQGSMSSTTSNSSSSGGGGGGGGGLFSFVNSGSPHTYQAAQDDPQSIPSAYHPLVSIYYLVKEKMDREQRNALVRSDDVSASSSTSTPLPSSLPRPTTTGLNSELAITSSSMSTSPRKPPRHKKSFSLTSSQVLVGVVKYPLLHPHPPHQQQQQEQEQRSATKRNGRGHKKAKSYAPNLDTQYNSGIGAPTPSEGTDVALQQSLSRKLTSIFSRSPELSAENEQYDDYGRHVFLKGLFSMRTTSTKPTHVIQKDLMGVLTHMKIEWTEDQPALFQCQAPGHSNSNSNSSGSNNNNGDGGTAAGTNGVHFEIHIVKVPWLLGMHGVQFRRVSGDSWEYRNLCSKILIELKL